MFRKLNESDIPNYYCYCCCYYTASQKTRKCKKHVKKLIKKQTYTKTEAYKLYSRVF